MEVLKLYQVDYVDREGVYKHAYVVTDKLDKALSIFKKSSSYEVVAINESLERDPNILIDNECIN
jgi:hypothetical protein